MIKKHREKINYVIAGVATTIMNYIVYILLTRVANIDEALSNIIAWAASVAFAYIVNRVFVFKSESTAIAAECVKFVLLRVISGIMDVLMFFVMVYALSINDILSKTAVQVMVIILNYIFSKLYVFK